MAEPPFLAETIIRRLSVYLGPQTARTAVRTFTERALGREADTLTRPDVPLLLSALKPMLRTLIGAAQCDVLVAQINRELGL